MQAVRERMRRLRASESVAGLPKLPVRYFSTAVCGLWLQFSQVQPPTRSYQGLIMLGIMLKIILPVMIIGKHYW
jgi:hypothetical protein